VIAKVNGREITVREYADYLLASLGKSQLDVYIDRLLIEAEAQKQGVAVSPDEVEKLVEERLDRTIKSIYRGDRDEFLRALERRETTIEERKAKDRQDIYYERVVEKLILKERKVTPEALQKEFERTYGPQGVQFDLRHVLVSTSQRTGADGEAIPARSESEARELAEKVHKELLGGADFVQLVKQYSDDTYTRRNDGRIPLYREGFYGKEFHEAVEKLSSDQPLSGVVRSRRGFHLIQLLAKKETQLDEVRVELEKLVLEKAPATKERHDLIQRLREAAKIVR
jgi:parvulin-like peptidyl-prolyl isomerase